VWVFGWWRVRTVTLKLLERSWLRIAGPRLPVAYDASLLASEFRGIEKAELTPARATFLIWNICLDCQFSPGWDRSGNDDGGY